MIEVFNMKYLNKILRDGIKFKGIRSVVEKFKNVLKEIVFFLKGYNFRFFKRYGDLLIFR